MVERNLMKEVVEMVKNIPATDEPPLKQFENTEGTDVLVPLQQEDDEIAITPKSEYDVVVESSLYKFNKAVNNRISQGWMTTGGVNVVQTNTGIKFYQSMERRNVDFVEEPEMPSENSEGDTQGPNAPLGEGMKFLENEPDLYEDVGENVNDR